jgi:hypothetical protein
MPSNRARRGAEVETGAINVRSFGVGGGRKRESLPQRHRPSK